MFNDLLAFINSETIYLLANWGYSFLVNVNNYAVSWSTNF